MGFLSYEFLPASETPPASVFAFQKNATRIFSFEERCWRTPPHSGAFEKASRTQNTIKFFTGQAPRPEENFNW